MVNVFVYGTLMFPEVVFELTKKNFQSEPAILHGFRRFGIFDAEIPRDYPAISEYHNEIVEGRILFDLDKESLKILDFFEEIDYIRKELQVIVNNQDISAYVYVWNPKFKEKLRSSWNPEEFKNKYLQNYISKVIPEVLEEYNSQK